MLIKIGRRFEIELARHGIFIALPWAKGGRWSAFLDRTGQGLHAVAMESSGDPAAPATA